MKFPLSLSGYDDSLAIVTLYSMLLYLEFLETKPLLNFILGIDSSPIYE